MLSFRPSVTLKGIYRSFLARPIPPSGRVSRYADMVNSKPGYSGSLYDGRDSPISSRSPADVKEEMGKRIKACDLFTYTSSMDGKTYTTNNPATIKTLEDVEDMKKKWEVTCQEMASMKRKFGDMERKFGDITEGELSNLAYLLKGIVNYKVTTGPQSPWRIRNQIVHGITLSDMKYILETRTQPWIQKLFPVLFGVSSDGAEKLLKLYPDATELLETRANRYKAGYGSKKYFAAFTRWSNSGLSNQRDEQQIQKNRNLLEECDKALEKQDPHWKGKSQDWTKIYWAEARKRVKEAFPR